MNDLRAKTPELTEIIALLRDSGLLLREGTLIERRKRWRRLDSGVEQALSECASATEEGRNTADKYLFQTRAALQKAKDSIEKATKSRGLARYADQDASLIKQLQNQVEEANEQLDKIEDIVDRKSNDPSHYNITLFGRTGAGKSTLMEILTNGEGKTIGKGAQRTTVDVRTYEWKGMKITDVPGIAAFNGEEDAETAHKAAKEADLIIFLITDDAPQQAEAEHLARLRMTGRPIIGVCNVKSSLRRKAEQRLFVRDSHKTFDHQRLDEIGRQFEEISAQYNPGQELPFIYTHLLARFTANRTQDQELAEQLKEESRFWEVEDAIAEKIAEKGAYLRTRSYTDLATEAALEAYELMLQHAFLMKQVHKQVGARVKELEEWRDAFRRRTEAKLQELISRTTGRLRRRITPFAETNWKDEKNFTQLWNAEIQAVGIEEQLRDTLKEVHTEMSTHLREIEAALNVELNLLSRLNTTFFGSDTGSSNHRRWIRWTSTAIGAVSAVVGTALMFIPGAQLLGAALGIGGGIINLIGSLIGRLSKSEEERRQEAVSKFREKALPDIDRIERETRRIYRTTFNEKIDEPGIATAISNLSQAAESAREANRIAREIAANQHKALLELNKTAFSQALAQIGHQDQIRRIDIAARIPGQAITLAVTRGHILGEEVLQKLETETGERITVITKGASATSIIENATGSKTVRIDQEAGIAEATCAAVDPATKIKVKLASQLTGLLILNQPQGA